MRIVEVGPEQLETLADLREALGCEMAEMAVGQAGWRDRFVRYLRERQERGELQCFAASEHDAFVGMAVASIVSDYRLAAFDQRHGFLNTLFVKPEHRGCGAGRALTSAAIAWLATRGCESVRLRPSPKAAPLYRRMGFAQSGELELHLRATS